MAYAGMAANMSNNTFYLYIGSYYWSLSPAYFSGSHAYVYALSVNGSFYSNYVSQTARGVRPAISLASGTKIADGDGSVDSPYVVE